MCGIFGLVDPVGVSPSLAKGMGHLLRHRGPDDEGYLYCSGSHYEPVGGPDTPQRVYEANLAYTPTAEVGREISLPRVVLGHRRLSIIDLTPAGHQPMSYLDRYWIVFNGEIYNYVEIRNELQSVGYHFKSDSDTEVILAAYDRWGEDCLAHFNGMWGLAILDQVNRTIFLARDRFGVKPLYYTTASGCFAFASEIKALIPILRKRPLANVSRLLDFLIWGVSDHTSETMFEGVYQLPPAHHLTIPIANVLDQAGGVNTDQLRPIRWYELKPRETKNSEGIKELSKALYSAVRLRLRADVPVGSCLSGGLDSSSIVCIASRILAEQGALNGQKTFTARSNDELYDESRYAQTVSTAAGVDANFVTPTAEGLLSALDELVWHQDEPFRSTSIYAQWGVFKAAQIAGVVVMLDGQGADEALAGYRGFFGAHLASLVKRGRLGAWLDQALAIRREASFSWAQVIGYTAAYLHPSFFNWVGLLGGRTFANRSWLKRTLHDGFRTDPLRSYGGHASSIKQMSIAQLTSTNLPMLLRWEDRNSMASSVEARVPFLDYRLVELALGLSDDAKVGAGISKRILRQAMRGLVPDQVLDRKDKMGFETSESLWITRDAPERMRVLLNDALLALDGIVMPELLRTEFSSVVAGKRPYNPLIWRIIVAGRWVRRFNIEFELSAYGIKRDCNAVVASHNKG